MSDDRKVSPLVAAAQNAATAIKEQIVAARTALAQLRPWFAAQAAKHNYENAKAEAVKMVATAGRLERLTDEKKTLSCQPLNELLRDVRVVWKDVANEAAALRDECDKELHAIVQADNAYRLAEEQRLMAKARELEQRKAELTAAINSATAAQALSNKTHSAAVATVASVQASIIETLNSIPDAAPTTFKVEGGGSVSVGEDLDFEVTDLAALAAAHPEAIEVKRGVVLALLRKTPDAVVPGVQRKMVPSSRARKA